MFRACVAVTTFGTIHRINLYVLDHPGAQTVSEDIRGTFVTLASGEYIFSHTFTVGMTVSKGLTPYVEIYPSTGVYKPLGTGYKFQVTRIA